MAGNVFIVGAAEDTRAVIDLLRTEAPAMLGRVTVLEPDADAVRRLADDLARGVAGGQSPSGGESAAGLSARLGSWRLWLLVGVAVVDAVVLFVPVIASALVLAAVVAPERLQWTARFLDALAIGRETSDGPGRAARPGL